jgi:hypothetical protein
MNLKCLLGLHKREWVYAGESTCAQVQMCTVCEREFKHCEQHGSVKWVYVADDVCEQKGICTRCNIETSERESHKFVTWEYASERECTTSSSCARCGVVKQRPNAHKFGDWISVDTKQHSSTCERCSEERYEDHDWQDIGIVGEVYRMGTSWAVTGYECTPCGGFRDNAYGE